MDPNTKTMTITGGAAESYMNKGSKTRRRRATAQQGGTSPGTMNQLASTKAPATPEAPPAVPSQPSNLAKVTNSVPAPLTGGSVATAKPVKVVLGPKAAKSQVILSPKKSTVALVNPAAKTRKHAKKIRMSLGGFGKRVTRANKIRFDAKKQGIEDIKKILKDAKLVKDTTKAPETVLRAMYSDYMMLKSRAL
jgi:hypothetical protein